MSDLILIIIEQSLLHIPLMLGAYISFSLLKVPDLSIESAYVVGAIAGAHMLTLVQNIPAMLQLPFVIIASFLGAMLVGLTSSLLTQRGTFPHLLSSIVTFGIFHGVNQAISAAYVSLTKMVNPLGALPYIAYHPELCIIAILGVCITALIYLLLKTQLGYCYAVYGNNPHFFKNYSISTAYVFCTGIMLANGLAGISGYLFAQSNMFVELNMGLGKALLCITALILGKTVIRTQRPFALAVPLIGTGIYFALQQLLLKAGFDLKYFTAVQACIVMVVLLYTYRTNTYSTNNDNLGV
jgi:putative ABC transport system permease protein